MILQENNNYMSCMILSTRLENNWRKSLRVEIYEQIYTTSFDFGTSSEIVIRFVKEQLN